jgi:hypothetical protein
MGGGRGDGTLIWSVYPKDSSIHAACRRAATYIVVQGSNHTKIFYHTIGNASTCVGRADGIDAAKETAQRHADTWEGTR